MTSVVDHQTKCDSLPGPPEPSVDAVWFVLVLVIVIVIVIERIEHEHEHEHEIIYAQTVTKGNS